MDACVRWRRWAKMALCIALRRGRGDGSDLFGPVLATAKCAEGYKRAGVSSRIWRRVCSILGQCWGLRRGVNRGLAEPRHPEVLRRVRPATYSAQPLDSRIPLRPLLPPVQITTIPEQKDAKKENELVNKR
jgi:hypothetical protein